MLLQQKIYEDESGKPVQAENITYIGTFAYIADGFFNWTCGNCKKDHSCRAYKINGVVFKCEACFGCSLLLRSDCDSINALCQDMNEKIRSIVCDREQAFIKNWSQAFCKNIKDIDLISLLTTPIADSILIMLYKAEAERRMMAASPVVVKTI